MKASGSSNDKTGLGSCGFKPAVTTEEGNCKLLDTAIGGSADPWQFDVAIGRGLAECATR